MKYNILFESSMGGGFNLIDLDENKLPIIINAYELGKPRITLGGKTYSLTKIVNFKIFTYDKAVDWEIFKKLCIENNIVSKLFNSYWYSEKCLELLGSDLTEKFIGDNAFGYKINPDNKGKILVDFINLKRIEELRTSKSRQFDLQRLIKLCEEVNFNYQNSNFLSVGMLGRTILNHIPPIFNCKSFDEVTNNYGGQSFKKNMQLLNGYFKNTVDNYLHQQIRAKDSLPNESQVEFRQPFDTLLAEIITILK